jgi:hypothetical protein
MQLDAQRIGKLVGVLLLAQLIHHFLGDHVWIV